MSQQREGATGATKTDGSELQADCSRCFGLCCVALPFTASADFAIDKAAGEPCRNLQPDFHCAIHARLREGGFAGCTVFDCFGAGQKVSQVTFGGRGWRESPQTAGEMFAVFGVVRQLHELLTYLAQALTLAVPGELREALGAAEQEVEQLSAGTAEALCSLDVGAQRLGVGTLLTAASTHVRAQIPGKKKDRHGADLIGADLAGADLRGALLRGAYLLGADLTRADLRGADLLGADLRGAELSGADLTDCLFLTQPQLTAAKGDGGTVVPPSLSRPQHWSR